MSMKDHIVMITKTSLYDSSLRKSSWPISKHNVNRYTRIYLKADFPFIRLSNEKYYKDLIRSCGDRSYHQQYLYSDPS